MNELSYANKEDLNKVENKMDRQAIQVNRLENNRKYNHSTIIVKRYFQDEKALESTTATCKQVI